MALCVTSLCMNNQGTRCELYLIWTIRIILFVIYASTRFLVSMSLCLKAHFLSDHYVSMWHWSLSVKCCDGLVCAIWTWWVWFELWMFFHSWVSNPDTSLHTFHSHLLHNLCMTSEFVFENDPLIVPSHHLSTVGARAFPVAGAYIWNCLPVDVTSAPSLPVFRQRLKTVLFSRSYLNMCYLNFVFLLWQWS